MTKWWIKYEDDDGLIKELEFYNNPETHPELEKRLEIIYENSSRTLGSVDSP